MKIKQAKYDYIAAENIKIINNIPEFNKLRRELKNDVELKLIAELSQSENSADKLELFAFFDHKNQQENLVKILEKIAKISETPLIVEFEDNEEITVTIYDTYIE